MQDKIIGYGSYWWTPTKYSRSLTDGLDEGYCVGRTGHLTLVRNPELAWVLALQKRTAESSSFLLSLRVAGSLICRSDKMATSGSVGHDTCTGGVCQRALGVS